MLQSEFTKRVGMEVSNAEFDAINVVYMASDLNKDEFCKAWAKMNASRIKLYKATQKIKAEKDALKERMWKFLNKLGKRTDMCCLISEATNEKEKNDLIAFGIKLTKVEPIFGHTVSRSATSVWLDLNDKLCGIS